MYNTTIFWSMGQFANGKYILIDGTTAIKIYFVNLWSSLMYRTWSHTPALEGLLRLAQVLKHWLQHGRKRIWQPRLLWKQPRYITWPGWNSRVPFSFFFVRDRVYRYDMIWSYVVIICNRYIALSVHPTLKVCLCFRPSVSLTVSASAAPTRAAFIPQSKLLLALWSSRSCNMLQQFSLGFIWIYFL